MEELEQIEQLAQIAPFYKKNPKLLKELTDLGVNKKHDILYKVFQNQKLFTKYTRMKVKKCGKITEALECKVQNKVIVYFADIGLYAVYTDLLDYAQLRSAIRDAIKGPEGETDDDDTDIEETPKVTNAKSKRVISEEEAKEITRKLAKAKLDKKCKTTPKFLINQIVLSDQKQRMVFVSSMDSVDLVRQYVKEFLDAETSIIRSSEGVEITVLGLVFDDLTEARNEFNLFCTRVEKKYPAVVKDIKKLRTTVKRSCTYKQPCLLDMLYTENDVDLQETLKSVWFGKAPKTIQVFNNCTINAVYGGSQIKSRREKPSSSDDDQISEIKRKSAMQWIEMNPPGEDETTGTYYRRYKLSRKSGQTYVTIQHFAGLVRESGYHQPPGGSQRYWVK
jgi:hypothetical protein